MDGSVSAHSVAAPNESTANRRARRSVSARTTATPVQALACHSGLPVSTGDSLQTFIGSLSPARPPEPPLAPGGLGPSARPGAAAAVPPKVQRRWAVKFQTRTRPVATTCTAP